MPSLRPRFAQSSYSRRYSWKSDGCSGAWSEPIGSMTDLRWGLRGAPSRLIGRAGRFWNDGVAGFTEIGILADRAGVLFEPQLDRIISALSKVEIEDGSIGLSSERPDERVALALP